MNFSGFFYNYMRGLLCLHLTILLKYAKFQCLLNECFDADLSESGHVQQYFLGETNALLSAKTYRTLSHPLFTAFHRLKGREEGTMMNMSNDESRPVPSLSWRTNPGMS